MKRMKKERYKTHLIDGNYYTVRQLTLKLGLTYHRIRAKIFDDKATTMEELKEPVMSRKKSKSVNFQRSMFKDEHGHWKMLARALKC